MNQILIYLIKVKFLYDLISPKIHMYNYYIPGIFAKIKEPHNYISHQLLSPAQNLENIKKSRKKI